MTLQTWGRGILGAALFVLASCAPFQRPPALPRRAEIEPTGSGEKFAALVQSADIIYFPSESVTLDSRSEASWKLLEALRHHAGSFALGWDLSGNSADQRDFLAEAAKADAKILSLRRSAQAVADETIDGFEAPPGDFERFARRFSSEGLSEAKLRGVYETSLLAEQFAAAKICAHLRAHGGDKILVFLRRDHLGRDHGVPYFVAQKTKARQLILNPQRPRESRAGLLAGN